MKNIVFFAVVAALLASVIPGFAMMSLGSISPEHAKKIGLEIRSNPAGTNALRVELEFEPKGQLTNYVRVDLILGDGDNYSLRATLQETPGNPGRICVGFAVARADLGKIKLRIVTRRSLSWVGHDIRVKDFLTAEKTGANAKP